MRLALRGISGHRERLSAQKAPHLEGKMAALQEAGCIEDPCSDSTELVEAKLRGMRSLSRFKDHGRRLPARG